MPTVAFITLGCKVNQYESQKIAENFEKMGFSVVSAQNSADVFVINSCVVTHTANAKSRYALNRAKRHNPSAMFIMTGCVVEVSDEIKNADNVIVVPNKDKLNAVDYLISVKPEFSSLNINNQSDSNSKPKGRTRAVLKVQDGCNQFCSYCIIPYARHELVSRDSNELISEAKTLAEQGYKEIVITGILVGAYGVKTGSGGLDLAGLMDKMSEIDGIERIRLSSIEVTQVTDSLKQLYRGNPKICPHLHLPLQSGDDGVLKSMNRKYTRSEYLSVCEELIQTIPQLAITTDVIVGFPGEDRQAFENSLKMVNEAGYLSGHVFRYSPRPGTKAFLLKETVSEPEKEARSKELIDEFHASQQRYLNNMLGETVSVLVETTQKNGLLVGHTPNYIKVQFPANKNLQGEIVNVELISIDSDTVIGEL